MLYGFWRESCRLLLICCINWSLEEGSYLFCGHFLLLDILLWQVELESTKLADFTSILAVFRCDHQHLIDRTYGHTKGFS